MSQDHNKKTLRQFQCRDYLWEIFEQMGSELECSVDYLINESMRQYARSRNYGARTQSGQRAQAAGAIPSLGSTTSASMPAARQPSGPKAAPRASAPTPAPAPTASVASAPPPLPSQQPPPPAGSMPSLFVIFNGQKIPVAKEEFVIGRGSKTADLPIKDGNISRRHAAIVLQNGAFYMKDLGSTNGIEFNGERVEARRIDEGDVYQLCDYELRFTYR